MNQTALFPAPPRKRRPRDARAYAAVTREAARVILADPGKYPSPAMQEVARKEMR